MIPDRLSVLQRTQRHRGTRSVRPEAKAGIQRFSERCVEGVEVDQRVRQDSVEGQSAGSRVHVHRYSVRGRGGDGGGGGEVSGFVIVPHRITNGIGADQTPGLIIPSKQTLVSVSSSADSSVSHRYMKPPAPLRLPVTAASQTISTQQLRPVVESVWMIGVRLVLVHVRHLPVVVRQSHLSVDCVHVGGEFTGIWRREQSR